MANSIKLCSLNCQGLADQQKRRDVLHKLKDYNYHVYCLQDIHISSKYVQYVRAEWGLNCIISPHSSSSRGVAILFNKNIEYKIHDTIIDELGNYIILDIELNGLRVTFVNLYAPNIDKPEFFTNIIDKMNMFQNDSYILVGDWNLVLRKQNDTFNYLHENNKRAKHVVLDMINNLNLTDVWRALHESDRQFTLKRRNPTKMARLDFFLLSEDLLSLATDSSIQSGYRSDHNRVTLTLQLSEHERGRGYWKFNNSLLTDKDFITMIKEKLQLVKDIYAM